MADEPLFSLGRLLLFAGLGLALLGGALLLVGRLPGLGDLPGDFRWETERGTSVYVPLGTMIVLSLLLTILVNVALWLWRG